MSQSILRRQTVMLAELKEILAAGVDDEGRPLSAAALDELRHDIASLEKKLGH
jgi:hypothetical protein